MIDLHTLRPIQIVDVSFQLLRTKFISSFLIALLISLPTQVIVWTFEISVTSSATELQERTTLLTTILQFLAIGISLCVTSNVLSARIGKIYSKKIFNDKYSVNLTSSHFLIATYHVAIQLMFAGSLIGLRFLLGRVVEDSQANMITYVALLLLFVPWIFATIFVGFSVPISTHEGGTFSQVLKRNNAVNKVHIWKLFGVYCICIFIIFLLASPSITILQIIISNNLITSEVGTATLNNIVALLVIAFTSTLYSFVLSVTYFNARIEHEGFDIAISIRELQEKGETSGKLLNTLSR